MSEKRTKHRISGEKQKKLRVAAYCRVSTLMDAQDTSFELQCEHYRGYITGREDYELVGMERFTRTAGAAGGRKAAERGIRAVRRHPG